LLLREAERKWCVPKACGSDAGSPRSDLRHDPLMKLAVGRCPETGDPLASHATISRMENSPSKIDAARAALAMVDHFCASVTPGEVEMFDIDDSFCAAHGGHSLPSGTRITTSAATNMHIYHVGSGAPVAIILRPAWAPGISISARESSAPPSELALR
jgi:hypothetical protein